MIRVVKKEDVLKYLEDPQKEAIERRLSVIRAESVKLKHKIRERPSRAENILSQLREITVELETSALAE